MKRISFHRLIGMISLCIFCINSNVSAQDIALVGMKFSLGNGNDKFSFVALKDIPSGDVYYFTDDKYDPVTNTFDIASVEVLFKFESPGLSIGDVIVVTEGSTNNTIIESCDGSVNCGSTMTLLEDSFSLGSDDELYCFSSTAPANSTCPSGDCSVIFNGMDEIHSSIRGTGTGDPLLPNSTDHPNAVNIDLPGPEGQFNIALRGNVLTTQDLSVASNYVTGDASSTVRFSQLNGATVSGAEIQVIGYDVNGIAVIPDGSNNPSCMLNTQLQTQEINSGPSYYSFTIQNLGTDALNLTGTPQVTISGSAAFSIAQQPSGSTIPANSQLDFGIDFNPTTAGTHTTTITIANDDADENPYTFVIGGEAVSSLPAPAIALVGMSAVVDADAFSFVALRDIMPNEVFYFTDDTYDEETNTFDSAVESLYKYQPATLVLAGDVVVVTEGANDNDILVTCTDQCINGDVSFVETPFSIGTDDALYCFTSPASNTTAQDIMANVDQIHSSMALLGNSDYTGHDCFHPTALHVKLNSNDAEFDPASRATTSLDDYAALQDPTNYINGAVSSTLPFDQTYCDAAGLQGTTSDYINRVQLNTIDNNSNQTFYSDFTDVETVLNMGSSYELEVGLQVAFDLDTIYAWIDFNQDLAFDNDTEAIDMGALALGLNGSSTGTFVVPQGIDPGITRMRVRSVYNNVNGDPCSNEFGEVEDYSIVITDLPIVNCGTPLSESYCYTNFDETAWSYAALDGSQKLRLEFTAGNIEVFWDKITIYDGANNTAPILFDGDNGGSLVGLTVYSTSPNIYMEVSSDVSVSCTSAASLATWEWNVQCVDITQAEATIAAVNVPSCASPVSTYDLEVDITDLGLSPNAYIITNNAGLPAVNVDNGIGIYTIPNVPLGTSIEVTIENTLSVMYNLAFTSIVSYCVPENDLCIDAIPIAINPYGTCPTNQTLGSSLGSNLDATITDCFGQDFAGVWYSFTTSQNQTAINFNFESINGSYHGFTIYDDCLGTSIIYCGEANVTDIYVPNLTPTTTYYILVFHGGNPGEFNICLSDPIFCPAYQDLVGDMPGTGIYSSANDLGSVDPNGQIISTQTIKNTAEVDYSAGREILLEQGFAVEQGALFHAYIDGCSTPVGTLQSGQPSMSRTTTAETTEPRTFRNPKKLDITNKKGNSPFQKSEKVKYPAFEKNMRND